MFNGAFAHSAEPISPLVLAQTRTTFSFLLFAPLLALTGNRSYFRISRRSIGLALVLGMFGVAGSNFLYYYGIQKTSVGTAIVLQYLAPLWVLLYMLARKQQRATTTRVVGVLLAVLGIALVIGIGGSSPIRVHPLGFAAAILAGVSFAIYNVGGSVLLKEISAISLMLYAMLGAATLWAIIHPPWALARMPFTAAQWRFLVGFAVFSMLVPYLLYFLGLHRLDATSAIVTSCLEPVFAILLAVTFIGESLHGFQIVGVLFVIGATILIQSPERAEVHSLAI